MRSTSDGGCPSWCQSDISASMRRSSVSASSKARPAAPSSFVYADSVRSAPITPYDLAKTWASSARARARGALPPSDNSASAKPMRTRNGERRGDTMTAHIMRDPVAGDRRARQDAPPVGTITEEAASNDAPVVLATADETKAWGRRLGRHVAVGGDLHPLGDALG